MSELITGYHQITFDEYLAAKQEIITRLTDMSEDFVVIGYLLRQIEANKAYEKDGYSSLKDFAKAELNLSESNVSRFMAINKRFSENGFGRNLLPQFRGFGYSKLQEMLTVMDEDMELITHTTTVAEIREIKAFEREEKKLEKAEQEENVEVVQAEVVSETVTNCHHLDESMTDCHDLNETVPVREYSDLEKVIIEFFRNERVLLTEIYQMSSLEDIVERINPSGNRTYTHKIYMLFMYGYDGGVILKQMLKGKTNYTWQQFIEATVSIFADTYTDHDSVWENFYGEPEKKVTSMETENVHVSEDKVNEENKSQEKEKSSDTAFDPTKTIYNKADERVEPEVGNEHTEETAPASAEDELEGQMHIEDYPEVLPEGFATSQDREKSSDTEILTEEKIEDVGRLTWNKPDGSWGLKHADIKELPKELYGVAYKLMKYERLKLSPEQIEDMLNEKQNTE